MGTLPSSKELRDHWNFYLGRTLTKAQYSPTRQKEKRNDHGSQKAVQQTNRPPPCHHTEGEALGKERHTPSSKLLGILNKKFETHATKHVLTCSRLMKENEALCIKAATQPVYGQHSYMKALEQEKLHRQRTRSLHQLTKRLQEG
eukprot:1149881-Pelagomonas_calceolata.AAC.2